MMNLTQLVPTKAVPGPCYRDMVLQQHLGAMLSLAQYGVDVSTNSFLYKCDMSHDSAYVQ